MIFDFMKAHSKEFSIEKMARVLKVTRIGYYKYIKKKEPKRKIENDRLLQKIKIVHKKSREIYGSPRIHAQLKKDGEACSRKLIAKIMKTNNIQSKIRKKWKKTTRGTKDLTKVVPNLLNQNFEVSTPNIIWVSDITYIWTKEGWLYLAAVMDLYSRKIVGFSTSITIDTKLIIRATEQAICNRMPAVGLIHHSDKGTQYTSNEFKAFAAKCGMILSMSGKGNCYDNAAMESFFHSFKTEHVFFCEYMTREEATLSIFEYIEIFYNRERTHSTLKYLSPVEFEETFPPILSKEEEELLPSLLQQSRVKLACAAMSASPAGDEAI